MSGSITAQITALEAQIAQLNAEIQTDQTTDRAAIPALQVQVSALNTQLVDLQAGLCFVRDTHILTDRGEVLIQDIKVGDLVVTLNGVSECMQVRWIGRQHFRGSRVKYGQPVLIRAGALGDGLPYRDLRVSADHSLFLDGCLVPARLLVNNTTIVSETGATEVDFYNLELDQHAIIVAEGVETELYLECGNRHRFDNVDEPSEWLSTRPVRGASAWLTYACAPLLWEGPRLSALRSRLAGLEPASVVQQAPDDQAYFPVAGLVTTSATHTALT